MASTAEIPRSTLNSPPLSHPTVGNDTEHPAVPADALGTPSQAHQTLSSISPSPTSQTRNNEQAQPNSSPRHLATELTEPIHEEACETESELAEPVTPVSPQSQHFQTHEDQHPRDKDVPTQQPLTSAPAKNGLATVPSHTPSAATAKPSPSKPVEPGNPAPLARRSTFNRVMSKVFKRSDSQVSQSGSAIVDGDLPDFATPNGNSATPSELGRRASQNPSSTTTRSNSPPTPGSPLEMATSSTANHRMPQQADFKDQKKARASTGLTFRGRGIKFASRDPPQRTRRAASFDAENGSHTPDSFWPHIPDAGAGTKARRISISLPDDFSVDVGNLTDDFGYQSKLGRHGPHLGKGAASKVTLMVRKGFANELYAVKEFRGKSKSETTDEYEKKIKSEYSIAKSLHHPNIVETISLCIDHGRWNHVMAYCSEGDLLSLMRKAKYNTDEKLPDRLCLFRQLIQGVNYLHDHGIAHRDIKLENLLITKDSKLKITDFGVSEVFCGTHPGLRESGGQCGVNMDHEARLCSPGICGSMPYIAPEVIAKKSKYDPRGLDVWGTAVVMLTLSCQGNVWDKAARGSGSAYDNLADGWEQWEEKHKDTTEEIDDDDYPYVIPFNMIKPAALRKMLLRMLHPDPAKRLTIKEVYNHRWVQRIDCCQPDNYEDMTKNKGFDATKMGSGKKIRAHNHLPGKNLDTGFIGNSNFD